MKPSHRRLTILTALATLFVCTSAGAVYYPYDGRVTHNVKRDRIIAIGEDHATLRWYCGPANVDYSSYWGAICFDTSIGWRTGPMYCWGGEDTTRIYLIRMSEGDGAGNINTSGGSSYDQFCAGTDCSGFVSNAWTSPRYSTSGFPSISDDISWDDLRMGDALNDAGSHIRLFDYFTTDTYASMLYESTSGGGAYWRTLHRSLSRNNNYQPIRYNSTYDVYDYPEPTITYIRRTGIERVQVRWDGQGDLGFKLYQSSDGSGWTLIRDAASVLAPVDRVCEVSGLLPDHTYYFKMTSENSGGETADSNVVAYRLDGNLQHRVLLVDGSDRYREQHGTNHTVLTRFGAALGSRGIGFDFCSNEAVVDEQVDLTDYKAVVWMLGEESTFDETFSWPEQMHTMNFLNGGGSLFVSGAEIGWDLDYRADSTTYKNGSVSDAPFYNDYLHADYVDDDAGTYHVQGASGTIFDGLDFYFDNGTHGTYDVVYPDMMAALGGATVALTYQGGSGGNACVYVTSASGSVVNMGFPFETIYPESARFSVMKGTLSYFNLPAEPPTLKTLVQSASDTVTITWAGHASEGFRLLQKVASDSWAQIQDEAALGSDVQSATVSGLSAGVRYAFKVQAVNGSGPGGDSDVLVGALGSSGEKILIVDGYDRWNSQSSGTSHTLLENFADALSNNSRRYDCCTNESVTEGAVVLTDYDIVMWMCGEESTESETLSYNEQQILQIYLQSGGKLFASGAEIGWDLVAEADTNNNYSNGSPNDTPFYNDFLKANYENDDSGVGSVTGAAGTDFTGLSFNFDYDGAHGVYGANYPDVLSTRGGSATALYYGSGPGVAGISYAGVFPSGSLEGKLVYFGFPFETIYVEAERTDVMMAILAFFADTQVKGWQVY